MKINEEVVGSLIARGLKISTAESCTGGLVAKLITDVAGASAVFEYGAVTYANRIKNEKLGVKIQTLEKYGAVSRQTAAEMAEGVRLAGGADIGVSATGIAGPTGAVPGKPNGTCFIAFSSAEKCVVKKISTGLSDRDENRKIFAKSIFKLIKEEM